MANQWNYTRLTGNKGESGDVATLTVSSTKTYYQQSTSASSIPTNWLESPPTATPGYYMWSKIVTTYSNGTTSTGYAVSKNGTNGTTPAVYTCELSMTALNSSVTLKVYKDGVLASGTLYYTDYYASGSTDALSGSSRNGSVSNGSATLSAVTANKHLVKVFSGSARTKVVCTGFCTFALGVGVSSIETLYSIGNSSGSKTTPTTSVQSTTETYPIQYSCMRITYTDNTVKNTNPVPIGTMGVPGSVGGYWEGSVLVLTT